MKKRQIAAVLAGIMAMSLAVPAMAADETEGEEVKLLIAAAASLEYSMEEKLIPLFEEQRVLTTAQESFRPRLRKAWRQTFSSPQPPNRWMR